MALVFDIATSAEFWRRVYPVDRSPSRPFAGKVGACASAWSEIGPKLPSWMTDEFFAPIGGRVHVLVFGKGSRRDSAHHASHVWGGGLPQGSLYKLGDGQFVCSPEFMFLMASTLLSTAQLIAFGCELCGLYGFDESERRGFRKRKKPLTCVRKLQRYLEGAQSCRGYAKSIAALSHVLDNSASPMETFDVMAMCLPYRLGGYCLHKPRMNLEIPLSSRASRIAGRRTCFADMGYSSAKLDIEHHGKLDHSSPGDVASDRARVNALKEMGYEVIELTYEQVSDLLAFEYIIQRAAKLLGKRLDKRKLGPTPERLALRREVLSWNRSAGRLR